MSVENIFDSELYKEPKTKFPSSQTKLILLGAVMCLGGYLLLDFSVGGAYALMIPGILLIIVSKFLDLGDRPILGEPLGKFRITEESILIKDQEITLAEISLISFWKGFWKEKQSRISLSSYYGGTENLFDLKLNDGQTIRHYFMVTDKKHHEKLDRCLKALETKGLNIQFSNV